MRENEDRRIDGNRRALRKIGGKKIVRRERNERVHGTHKIQWCGS